MEKPTEVIFDDGSIMPFIKLCKIFKSKYCWLDEIKYELPEKWLEENN